MNPLDFDGPTFLLFYFLVGLATLALIYLWVTGKEARAPLPKLNFSDPVEIAFLRGGKTEAIRIASFALIDRGFLKHDGYTLRTQVENAVAKVRRPIEKAIVKKLSINGTFDDVLDDAEVRSACAAYQSTLARLCLLPDRAIQQTRALGLAIGIAILGGLSAAKLVVAFQRHHSNVGFLIILTAIFLFVLVRFCLRKRTALGDRMVRDLKSLFKDLQRRASQIRPGGQTNEAALLAAVFGISALSVVSFRDVQTLFLGSERKKNESSSCGASCGSGSGCGGGGGCGGCGG